MFDFNAMATPGRPMDELARFLSFWLGKPGPDYGDSAVDLAARPLPEPLCRLYAVAGRWPMTDEDGNHHVGHLFTGQDSLRPLSRLETSDDGKLIFIDENQGVWAVATLPEGDDPPVWVEDSLEEYGTGRWGKVADSLSEFLVTFCLQELVFDSPSFRWDKRLSALFDSGELGPAVPILTNGPYVYSKPGRGHSFHLLGTDVLVGRFFGRSLGFATRDAAAAALLDANESEIATVMLTTPNGWQLTINLDGSGKLACDGGPDRAALVPVGSFDFPALRDQLLGASSEHGDVRRGYTVYFMRAGRGYAHSRPIRDVALAEATWTHAISVATNRGADFDRVLRAKPPSP